MLAWRNAWTKLASDTLQQFELEPLQLPRMKVASVSNIQHRATNERPWRTWFERHELEQDLGLNSNEVPIAYRNFGPCKDAEKHLGIHSYSVTNQSPCTLRLSMPQGEPVNVVRCLMSWLSLDTHTHMKVQQGNQDWNTEQTCFQLPFWGTIRMFWRDVGGTGSPCTTFFISRDACSKDRILSA